MRAIPGLIKNNIFFFLSFLLLCILSCYILFTYDKQSDFILLNSYHSALLDKIFIFFTALGNGWLMIIVGLLCFFLKKKKLPFLILSSFLLSGLIAQILKYFIDEARPGILLEHTNYQYFIKDVTLHSNASFPSGHTASAFAFAAVLAFYCKNKWLAIPLFMYACLVGYSRIYIGDHFLNDVLAGAVIGVISGVVCYLFLENYQRNGQSDLQKNRWVNGGYVALAGLYVRFYQNLRTQGFTLGWQISPLQGSLFDYIIYYFA